jgi:putative spermidine/putrescine transport system permease protein
MQPQRHQTLSERIASKGLRVHCALIFLFLVAPILAIVPLSFNSGSFFSYPMDGFSLRWYEQAFGSNDWQLAFANSIGIGAVATLIATCLGTLAALGLSRPVFPFRAIVMPLLISPMIIPIVVVAAGFYLIFSPLGLVNSYPGVVLAHAALGTPFVVITVTASLLSFDQSFRRSRCTAVDDIPPRHAAVDRAGCRDGQRVRVRHVVRRGDRHPVHRRS